MNEYLKQAEDFASKVGLEMEYYYTGHQARLGKYITATFQVVLTRKGQQYSFTYSDSINNSWQYSESFGNWKKGLPPRIDMEKFFLSKEAQEDRFTFRQYNVQRCKKSLDLYSTLACLTNYNPGTFSNFCDDYGYEEDSRKAFETYIAVQKEWEAVERLLGDVIDELREIN